MGDPSLIVGGCAGGYLEKVENHGLDKAFYKWLMRRFERGLLYVVVCWRSHMIQGALMRVLLPGIDTGHKEEPMSCTRYCSALSSR